jgi:hypothetical protein
MALHADGVAQRHRSPSRVVRAGLHGRLRHRPALDRTAALRELPGAGVADASPGRGSNPGGAAVVPARQLGGRSGSAPSTGLGRRGRGGRQPPCRTRRRPARIQSARPGRADASPGRGSNPGGAAVVPARQLGGRSGSATHGRQHRPRASRAWRKAATLPYSASPSTHPKRTPWSRRQLGGRSGSATHGRHARRRLRSAQMADRPRRGRPAIAFLPS